MNNFKKLVAVVTPVVQFPRCEEEEMAQRYCSGQNANRLPFGCHAWTRYDRDFREPYLLTAAVQTAGEVSTP